MTDTRQKLFEAKYFLGRMIENQDKRNIFKYNLSAFLAAFRSVTMIMQEEFDKVPGFVNWYRVQQDRMKADDKMRLLNTKRTMTIHQKPVEPHALVSVSLTEQITVTDSVSVIVTRADGTVERYDSAPSEQQPVPAKTEAIVQWCWFFDEVSDIDVVRLCQECMTKLESFVLECEQRFGSSYACQESRPLSHNNRLG